MIRPRFSLNIYLLIVSLSFALVANAQTQCATTIHNDGSRISVCTAVPFDDGIVTFEYPNGDTVVFQVAFDSFPNGIHLHGLMPNGVYFEQFCNYLVDEDGRTCYTYVLQDQEYAFYFIPTE